MAWVYLVIAGLLEVAWALGLKWSDGFNVRERPGATAATFVALVLSFVLLAQAGRTLPIGTAYAVWTGIGAAGAAIGGIVLYGEPANAARVVCLVLLVAAIVGLKATSGTAS